ncbi:hypothetical protein QJS10_CPA06g01602 [Acorus calamus]|uniref:Uncharacterized protein n=1 Tax=Acorus calamus TaxID=4465 RepID=A0AAV9EMH9_ACOCL|nr:hypothetical protein QJS10_CPA06g01602 [Acorus calamus]
MVAISLYRGNLHRVPDVPRRWPMPSPSISLPHFKHLLRKRSKALHRLLPSPAHATATATAIDVAGENAISTSKSDDVKPIKVESLDPEAVEGASVTQLIEKSEKGEGEEEEEEEKPSVSLGVDAEVHASQAKVEGAEEEKEKGKLVVTEVHNNLDVSDKKERKNELEEKLKILNDKKHQLVQMLKQILNAEEEMKRRCNVQLSGIRTSVPLQVDVPKMSSEMNSSGYLEGESDETHHNTHVRPIQPMYNASPSASLLSRPTNDAPQHNMAIHTPRAIGIAQTSSNMSTGGVSASPSRFAPSGHQGHHALSLPPVSVSGTHFIASSPSPAASSGTSVFRDPRLTSPWNER